MSSVQPPAAGMHLQLGDHGESAEGGDEADTISGGSGNDVIVGGYGDDSLTGGEGNDVLEGGVGLNFLSGGAGVDTAVYKGPLAGCTITTLKDGTLDILQKDLAQDHLVGIEVLRFDDATIDLRMHAWAEPVLQQHEVAAREIVGLYIGLFGRLPEAEGMRYWTERVLGGETVDRVAEVMEDIGRPLAHIGNSPYVKDKAGFAASLFANLLGESGSAAAADPLFAKVEGMLAQGVTRCETVLWLARQVEAQAAGNAAQAQFVLRTQLGIEHGMLAGVDYGSASADILATQGMIQRSVSDSDSIVTLTGLHVDLSAQV